MKPVGRIENSITRFKKAFLNYKETRQKTAVGGAEYVNVNQGGATLKLACCVGKSSYGDDWFCTDIEENPQGKVYFLDITKEFPVDSGTLDYIFIEHGVEHVDFEGLLSCFLECQRTLKTGGILRFSSPSLKNWMKYYFSEGDFVKFITQFATQSFMPQIASMGLYSKALVINNALRSWGHKLVLDFETYSEMLQGVGFSNIKEVPLRQSEHTELQNMERHATAGAWKIYNEFEVTAVEAIK